jgi:rRNA maturation endonuclease Nob1
MASRRDWRTWEVIQCPECGTKILDDTHAAPFCEVCGGFIRNGKLERVR